MDSNRRMRGFTLIELMVVVAIVAILASIAYPSYKEFTKRSARADAKAALLENAQFMERNFTSANRYDQDSAGNDIETASLPVQQSPRDGAAKYDITVEPDQTAFVLKATPVAASLMDGDACGVLSLDNLGSKNVSGSRSKTECWNK